MQRNERKMIHVSFDLIDEFIPRVPKYRCIGENNSIPRICAGPSVLKCLQAIPKAGEVMYRTKEIGLPVIIHAYYMRCKHAVFDVKEYAGDASTTGEIWLLESPSEVRRIDYLVTFPAVEWYVDAYGERQRFPVDIQIERTRYQDNLENFINAFCETDKDKAEFRERLPNISFRTLMTNLDDVTADIAKKTIARVRINKMRMYTEEYKEIKDKVILCYGELPEPMPKGKTVIKFVEFGEYYEKRFKIVHNGACLSIKQCAIAADEGNLCFGYHMKNDLICVHTD